MKKILTILLFLSHVVFGQNFVENEILVQVNPKASTTELFRQLESEYNIDINSKKCISKPLNIFLLKLTHVDDYSQLLTQLRKERLVINAQLNHIVTERETVPNDPNFVSNQWHLKNTGQTGGTVDADIDATEAWT
jgi:hypothetical protein